MASSSSSLRSSCRRPGAGSILLETHTPAEVLPSVRVLSKVFRGKFLEGLEEAFAGGQLAFCGNVQQLADPKQFQGLLDQLSRKKWVVYAKPPFGGPEHVLQYLARYTHRVAISNHRLVSSDGEQVTFRWKDYTHGNQKRKMTVSADEFLRRFLLHVLPGGFVRIRYFGFLANRCRAASIELCRKLIGDTRPMERKTTEPLHAPNTRPCPRCSGTMFVIERLSAAKVVVNAGFAFKIPFRASPSPSS